MILIVDDQQELARVLQRVLKRYGYDAETVTGGEEALAYLEGQIPELVLLDVMMPGVSGIDVLRNMKGQAVLEAVPVVIYTAGSTPEQEAEAERLGACGLLRKGTVSLETLLAVVRQYAA
jgi:CheY-like chemotaxis protein